MAASYPSLPSAMVFAFSAPETFDAFRSTGFADELSTWEAEHAHEPTDAELDAEFVSFVLSLWHDGEHNYAARHVASMSVDCCAAFDREFAERFPKDYARLAALVFAHTERTPAA